MRTLEGHTKEVFAIGVGDDGCMYSGSGDMTVRAWQGGETQSLRVLTVSVFYYGIFYTCLANTLAKPDSTCTLHLMLTSATREWLTLWLNLVVQQRFT